MKTLRKIIFAIVIMVFAMTLAFVAVAVGGDEYTGTVEDLTTKVAAVSDAEGYEAKAAALDEVIKYLENSPVDPTAEGYELQMSIVSGEALIVADAYVDTVATIAKLDDKVVALDKATKYASAFDEVNADTYASFLSKLQPIELEVANQLLENVDVANGTGRNGVNINKLKAFLKKHTLNEGLDGYGEFAAAWQAKQEEQTTAIANQISEYNKKTALLDYEGVPYKQIDFSQPDSKGLYGFTQNISESVDNFFEVREDESENHYYYFEYNIAAHSYTRVDLPKYENGTVIEFDITYFGHLPEYGIEIGHSSVKDAAGNTARPGYGEIGSNGKFQSKNRKISFDNLIVPGEWTRITMVYTTATGEIEYYINYELIGKDQGNGGLLRHKLNCFRIGSVNLSDTDPDYDGDFAIDNFLVYEGTNIRELDYVSKMTDDERFAFYCDYLADPDASITDLKAAYEKSGLLLSNYWDAVNKRYLTEDETLRQAVDVYNAFDFEPIYIAYQKDNLATLVGMIEDVLAVDRKLSNVEARANKIALIDEFMTINGADIYKGEDSDYTKYILSLGTERNYIEEDRAILQFNGKVDRFFLAFTAKAMKQHYDNCQALLENIDDSLRSEAGYEEFNDRYERFFDLDGDSEDNSALNILNNATRRDNSKIIVECVAFIDEYKTQEEWDANFEFMDKYVLTIREAAKGDYDNEYEGIDEALQFFETVNGYFYEKLQQSHISHMQEQLDKYKVSESYIMRMGLCSYLDNYLADPSNDINHEDERVLAIKQLLGVYKSELSAREEDYKYYLEQNTVYFVNTVTRMILATDYLEMLEAYNEASIYYYAMNAGDEDVSDEIKAFEDTGAKIRVIEQNSKAFCEAMVLYSAATTANDKFYYLVVATEAVANAEPAVEGVSEAISEYQTAYNEYMAEVNATNSDLDAATEVMAAARANSGVAPIVSAILALLGIE